MKGRRDLVLANLAGVVVLLLALLAGWRDAAGFGLAVLAILNLTIILRERMSRHEDDGRE